MGAWLLLGKCGLWASCVPRPPATCVHCPPTFASPPDPLASSVDVSPALHEEADTVTDRLEVEHKLSLRCKGGPWGLRSLCQLP